MSTPQRHTTQPPPARRNAARLRRLACAALASLAYTLAPAAVAADALEIAVTQLDGKTVRGQLVSLYPEIILAGPNDQLALSWVELTELRPLFATPPPIEPHYHLWRFTLTDGSRIDGRVRYASPRGFELQFQADGAVQLELEKLHSIIGHDASEPSRDRLSELLVETDRKQDVALIERGEKRLTLRGLVQQVTPEGVRFAWKDRELQLPWEHLAGVVLARPAVAPEPQRVLLRDGDVFAGRVTGGDDTHARIRSANFADLQLPWTAIERIACRSRRLIYLSELTPARYEFTPFFQKIWTFALDRTLAGGTIRLAGRTFERGVTMHSRSSLSYALDGRYATFVATVGIADEMQDRGDAHVLLLADGRVLWEAEHVRGGQAPSEIRIDITGVQELTLHVDFGGDLDLSDHVCWAGARVIR